MFGCVKEDWGQVNFLELCAKEFGCLQVIGIIAWDFCKCEMSYFWVFKLFLNFQEIGKNTEHQSNNIYMPIIQTLTIINIFFNLLLFLE